MYIIPYYSLFTIGVLLSAMLSSVPGRAPFLLVLDARSMEEVGRAEFPGTQMHKDIHGLFVPFSTQ